MDWNQGKDAVLMAMVGGFFALLGWSAVQLVDQIKSATSSIQELNVNVARILQRMEGHENRMDHHEVRITKLEDRVS